MICLTTYSSRHLNEHIAIIGDIHGDADRLSFLIRRTRGRRRIFVGDYVNRGAETRRTLDQLSNLREEDPWTICLLGNHEVALLDFLAGALPFHRFAGIGGIATIRSYMSRASGDVRAEFFATFPDSHHRLLSSCQDYFETPELLVSHCGLNPDDVTSRERMDMVMGRHQTLFSPAFAAPKLVVCGHYVQLSCRPYVRDQVVCLDTGCGTLADGPLTALLLPERTLVQV